MPEEYSAENLKIFKPDPRMWDSVDISKDGFSKNLLESACASRDFTRQYVTNILPDEMRYLVCLGCSYDENPLHGDEKTFPEDYSECERFFEDYQEASSLLWRDGMVPVSSPFFGVNCVSLSPAALPPAKPGSFFFKSVKGNRLAYCQQHLRFLSFKSSSRG